MTEAELEHECEQERMQRFGVLLHRERLLERLDREDPSIITKCTRVEHLIDALGGPLGIEDTKLAQGFVAAVGEHQAEIMEIVGKKLVFIPRVDSVFLAEAAELVEGQPALLLSW